MVRFLISMPEEMKNTLRKTARAHGQTLSGLIRQVLWEWIEKKQNETL